MEPVDRAGQIRNDSQTSAEEWKEQPECLEIGRNSWTMDGAAGAAGGLDKTGEANRPSGQRTGRTTGRRLIVSNDDETTGLKRRWLDTETRQTKEAKTGRTKTARWPDGQNSDNDT